MPEDTLALAVLGHGLVDPNRPWLRVDDEAVLRGRAVFETLRVYAGRPFRLPAHLERLTRSADVLGLDAPDAVVLTALVVGARLRKPAVSKASDAFQHRFGHAAHPDRDRPLYRQRIDAGRGDVVVLAVVRDDRLRPQLAQEIDLLLHAPPAIVKGPRSSASLQQT